MVVSDSPTSSIVTVPRIAAHRDAQQLAAAERAHRAHGVVDRGVTRLDRARLLLQRHPGARSQQLLVVEPGGRLRDPLHELADVARAREHAREALGRAGRVAQHPQEPGRVAEALAQPAEGEQAVVGIDPVGEPPDHHRHEVPLDGRLAAQPARQRRDVAQRPGRVGEADRGEAVVRLLRRERPLLGGKRRDRRQQRAVEEPDMDVAHLALDGLPLVPDLLAGVGETARAREHAQILRARGHEVRAAQVAQLHAVLEQPQHPVVARERGGLGPADVALGDERVERVERAALTDAVVGEAVHELEQLHRELDVADAAGAELELVRRRRRPGCAR